jgi:hypothetical protein
MIKATVGLTDFQRMVCDGRMCIVDRMGFVVNL